jgi:hypothetical protein
VAGQSVTLLLNEYVDISRGDVLACSSQPATLLKQVTADVCWMADEPLDLRRKYWIKHGTRQTMAKVTKVDSILDVNTQQPPPGRGPEAERHRAHRPHGAAAAGGRRLRGHPRDRRLHPDRRSHASDGARRV